MSEQKVFEKLEKELKKLRCLTKKKRPTCKDNRSYDRYLVQYITWIGGENTERFDAENGGFSEEALNLMRRQEERIAKHLAIYSRNNQRIPETKEIFKKYANIYGVDETLSEGYYWDEMDRLEIIEKAKHKYSAKNRPYRK